VVYAVLDVASLLGGHSGMDIDKAGRTNAIALAARILYHISTKIPDMWLVSLEGGVTRNAIARDCRAALLLPASAADEARAVFDKLKSCIVNEYTAETQMKLTMEFSAAAPDVEAIGKSDTRRILSLLRAAPYGVYNYSKELDIVETSNNIGCVSLTPSGSVFTFCSLQRSIRPEKLDDIGDKITAIGELAAGSIEHSGRYASWTPAAESPLLSRCKTVYTEFAGTEPQVKVIHAGLECGVIGSRVPSLDMIAFGPNIRNPHSPDECVSISSVVRVKEFLYVLLESFASNRYDIHG